jgi:hypothetical protein
MHPAQNDPRDIDELFAAALTDLEDAIAACSAKTSH